MSGDSNTVNAGDLVDISATMNAFMQTASPDGYSVQITSVPSVQGASVARARAEAPIDAPNRVSAPALTRKGLGAPMTTRELVATLRARLRVVNSEIRLRKRLERERAQIKSLLEAAKAKRLRPATVQGLRRAV